MANLKINLPLQTGSVEHDFNELYSWANRLVSELRTLLHVLDSSNIRSIDASKLIGCIDISRLTGAAPELYVNGEGGVILLDGDGNEAARVYFKGGALHIEADKVYINGEELDPNV